MYATTQKQENRYLTESDLHRYQIAIRDRIIKQKKVAVWVDMGLGKTAATATAMDKLLDAGKVKRVLVIAPPRVAAETWPTEFVKWEHLKKRRCVV
ncbi:MAG: ATP-dependent helicase, partial [Chloroflexi bacterium]